MNAIKTLEYFAKSGTGTLRTDTTKLTSISDTNHTISTIDVIKNDIKTPLAIGIEEALHLTSKIIEQHANSFINLNL